MRRATGGTRLGRRRFLALGAAAVGAGIAACAPVPARPDAPGPGATTAPPTAPSGTPAVPDWAARLREHLPGGLLLPDDPGYDTARRSYNTRFDTRRPAAVATCTGPADVQACVAAARAAGLPLAARSGGHSYAGYSAPDGALVVDLAGTAGVRVEGERAVVGAGTRLIEVYAGVAAAGRCLPGGSCPTVGIAGLTLGGGVGVLSRRYGLTCDLLESAGVVTADGRAREVSATAEPDLFWALRGGGGGNLGIVTSFTFRTVPAPRVAVFSLHFPAGAGPGVLAAWQQWVATAPDALWSNCVLSGGTPPGCRVGGCHVGPVDALDGLLDQFVGAAATPPQSRFAQAMGYLDAMRFMAGCARLSPAQCRPADVGGQLGRESFVASSCVLRGPVPDPAAVVGLLDGRPGTDLLLDALGGAVAAVAPDATAFPHRAALATAQVYTAVPTGADEPATAAMRQVRDGLRAITGGGGYVNYIDPTLPDWADAYYGDNLPRLRRVAARYDPDGVFGFAQGLVVR